MTFFILEHASLLQQNSDPCMTHFLAKIKLFYHKQDFEHIKKKVAKHVWQNFLSQAPTKIKIFSLYFDAIFSVVNARLK